MIEALKSEEVVAKAGGRFKLCAMIQKRLKEIVEGSRPLVDREGRSDLELVIEEIMQDKIVIDYDRCELPTPAPQHVRDLLDRDNTEREAMASAPEAAPALPA
ncbi:MAG: DNA-directed RNA polymerase subunit omega [Planctomycetota bacterium]